MSTSTVNTEASPLLLVTKERRLIWGGSAPITSPAAWGARALYQLATHVSKLSAAGKRLKTPQYTTEATIDLLRDRQDAHGEPADREALQTWLNKSGLPKLKKLCVKESLSDDDDRTLVIDDGGYHLEANPNESCGYLYIIAWKVAEAKPKLCPVCSDGACETKSMECGK